MKSKKKLLVTVGTTEFQELIKYIDSQQFIELLKQTDELDQTQTNHQDKLQLKSFSILLQIGAKAQYQPQNFQFIRLSDRISDIYHQSDLIISHGGAGTLLQNLHDHKKIIAIANNTLAGNHQLQLVNKLYKQGYLLGFSSVQDFKDNPEKIKNFLKDQIKFHKYQNVTNSILNDIIFNEN